MTDHPVLGQVALGYCPLVDRPRTVTALRLTVFPERPDAAPDAAALFAALEEVWPAPEADRKPVPQVSLNLAGEALLARAMATGPGPQMMVEVPAFMAGDPAQLASLTAMRERGSVLVIKGRPVNPLTPEVLSMFTHSIVDMAEDRRAGAPAPAGVTRNITCIQTGARTSADYDLAFTRGAVAVAGWPWEDAPPKASGRSSVPADISTVMDLINGVDREEPVAKLEGVLRRDPTLAFRLMRYLNSPAFGLSVEINSFSHALMMLGYQRLKRWLALLLASSAKGANAKPVMYAAVRRGLLMEELGRQQDDAEVRGEMFICGVFSLLDRLLQQPFKELLPSVPVPDRVAQALRGEGGPYAPFLELVEAIEQSSLFDIRERSEALFLSPAVVNRAVLGALLSARQLDG
ncbi:MAG: HDOD domain-containing protein [Rubrivivax sp.]|nr:HDOD domain-containing protein [Rubrivivax sp.]